MSERFGERSREVGPRRIAIGLLLYAIVASSIGSALVARGIGFPGEPTFVRLLLWQAPTYILWGALAPLVAGLTRLRWSLPVTGAAAPLFVGAMSAFNVWWTYVTHPNAAFISLRGLRFSERFSQRWPIDLLIYSLIAAAVFAYRWMLRAAEATAAQARAEQQLAAAQLQAVKSRLQPHFLFNALHTITALVERDPARAGRMIQNLSELLRLTLNRHDQQMTTVAKELETVRLYLAIQKERFGERLQVTESIDDGALPCLVPDILLQPVVENAVVHGIAPLRRGGEVSIEIRRTAVRLIVSIADDGTGVTGDFEEGIGLGATRERLRQLYGADHRFSISNRPDGGTIVNIDLPAREAHE